MSEEVNLSEESNSQEEVLDQDFLLEKVDEMRDLIHQQRFAECKPMLVAIFKITLYEQHNKVTVLSDITEIKLKQSAF